MRTTLTVCLRPRLPARHVRVERLPDVVRAAHVVFLVGVLGVGVGRVQFEIGTRAVGAGRSVHPAGQDRGQFRRILDADEGHAQDDVALRGVGIELDRPAVLMQPFNLFVLVDAENRLRASPDDLAQELQQALDAACELGVVFGTRQCRPLRILGDDVRLPPPCTLSGRGGEVRGVIPWQRDWTVARGADRTSMRTGRSLLFVHHGFRAARRSPR